MTTNRKLELRVLIFLLLVLLILLLPGCRLPDTWGIGYLEGSIDGSTIAQNPFDFGGIDTLEARTDLDARAVMLSIGWSAAYPVAKRTERRLEQITRALAHLQEELELARRSTPASEVARVGASPDPNPNRGPRNGEEAQTQPIDPDSRPDD